MREIIAAKEGWRLFKDKNVVGLPRWVIENSKTRDEIILNGLWYNRKKVLQIFKDIT